MQQLALLALMRKEFEDAADLEFERFRMQMIANNPGHAQEIVEILDKGRTVEPEAPEVTDDSYDAQETSFIIDELRRMGFVVQG